MSIRAAFYIRVSTDEQTEYSPTAQLKALQKYADSNSMTVLPRNIFIDEGISGRTADKRPEFMRMIAAAKREDKPFDVILVHKFDRFARSREDSVVYKSLLRKKCGVKVISITESVEDDRISLLLEPMLEALAEYYSVNLSEEVKKGMTEKAYRGEYQTVAPFGYRWLDGILTVDEGERSYVEYIFNSYLSGVSRHSIACRLNAMGVRSHRGNPMESRSIGYILENPVYCGYSRWTAGEGDEKIIAKGDYPAIIDEELFERVRQRLASDKLLYNGRKRPQAHCLSGLFYCGSCGASLAYSGKNGAMQCWRYVHKRCKVSHSLSVKRAEKIVFDELKTITSAVTEDYVKRESGVTDKALKSGLNELKKRLKRLKEAYLEGIFDVDEYKREKAEIDEQMDKIGNEINGENTSCAKAEDIFFNTLNAAEKNTAVHSVIEKIVYDKESMTLHFYYYV